MIDLLNLEPNKISRDLTGKFVLLYGPPKIGKTSLSALFPSPLLLAFEHGYNALSGVYAVDITSWSDFKKCVQQLKTEKVREKYKTIVVDTVGIATDLCEKYVLNQYDINTLGDLPWGQGWNIYRKEFDTPFRELSQLGYGIVFIAHSKDKPSGVKDKDGNDINKTYPDINKTGLNAVNRLVDVIAYMGVEWDENKQGQRYFYTRETPLVFGGSRYKYLAPKIKLGYEELVNAIAEAIEKEVAEGAEVKDNTDLSYLTVRSFEEIIAEAKELWGKLTKDHNVENVEKINAIITEVFGKPVKLSEVDSNDSNLLEQVVAKMRVL